MEMISYIATVIDSNQVEISICDVIPDFVHAVIHDSRNNVDIYFSADSGWTNMLEKQALHAVYNDVYDPIAL